jgi:hypothetical protein
MSKAKVGVLLAGAYGLGLAVLLAVGLALPCGTLPHVRTVLSRVPAAGHRAAQLVRVAVHAGSLGVKHLPALLEPQGVSPRPHSVRFCVRESTASCGSTAVVPTVTPIIRVFVRNDG